MKQLIFIAFLASFGGCSNFTLNGTICQEIAQEPNTQNIPQKCQKYDKKKAEAAFFKKKKQQQADVEDIIKFQKDSKEE